MRAVVLAASAAVIAIATTLAAERPPGCPPPLACRPLFETFIGVEAMPRLAERSALLFLGTVTKVEMLPGCEQAIDVTFRVQKSWKGLGLTSLTVRTSESYPFMPFPFVLDHQYLVAATSVGRSDGVLGLVQGFTPLEVASAAAHIQALDAWRRAKFDERSK
jgi:hypothetical protein